MEETIGTILGVIVLTTLYALLTLVGWAWLIMLAVGATDIGHPSYWQCIPAGFLTGAAVFSSRS